MTFIRYWPLRKKKEYIATKDTIDAEGPGAHSGVAEYPGVRQRLFPAQFDRELPPPLKAVHSATA
ncbi:MULTISPECIES: hypothetical protein [unclassified Streptomyces]|uniref:hypothetical protein n=1 Tax=unclassified Streptomyces TaxID=2593676 RepID=UPI00131A4E5A|nr:MULTISPECIES: hypothetical protein [unclassified Streptomyces]